MRLEALHRVIKYCYLHGKTNKRVDKLISALLKLTRNKVFDRLTKFIKNAESEFERATRIRHDTSQTILDKDINKVAFNQWTVVSQTHDGHKYVVRQEGTCKSATCTFGCTRCKICVHTITCSCHDSVLRRNICKHMHAVCKHESSNLCQQRDNNEEDETTDVEQQSQDCKDKEAIDDIISSVCSLNELEEKGSTTCTKHSDCIPMLQAIITHLQKPTVEEQAAPWLKPILSKVLTKLDSISPLVKDTSLTSSLPPNKKIEKQQRFYSTKRKAVSTSQRMPKPTLVEQKGIIDMLSNSSTEGYHTGFDHDYAKQSACSSKSTQ
ncbi:uncharacterized protein LOC125947398 [Dermacentor silvarum]|uniref:uncharacterized protein LOC125947398 n=1 Tax=Dermacentor silvarum TaxID=543639 RepID=UPI0021014355|nr:uncharacterized protein LOC125947398 [Dermacentor silvarum]